MDETPALERPATASLRIGKLPGTNGAEIEGLDLSLPLDARPRVGVGEKVYATETVLAELGVPPGEVRHG